MSFRPINGANTFRDLSDLALERGLFLRDNRATSLDGSGYTLRPLKSAAGPMPGSGKAMRLDDLAAVAETLSKFGVADASGFPVLVSVGARPGAETTLSGEVEDLSEPGHPVATSITAIKPERPTPQVLRDVSEGIRPQVESNYLQRKARTF